MEFIDIATEQTTAATDGLLALVALVLIVRLQKLGKTQPWKSFLWMMIFSFLAMAAVLGTIVHGFKMSESLKALLWHPLNLALGIMVSLFV